MSPSRGCDGTLALAVVVLATLVAVVLWTLWALGALRFPWGG